MMMLARSSVLPVFWMVAGLPLRKRGGRSGPVKLLRPRSVGGRDQFRFALVVVLRVLKSVMSD